MYYVVMNVVLMKEYILMPFIKFIVFFFFRSYIFNNFFLLNTKNILGFVSAAFINYITLNF